MWRTRTTGGRRGSFDAYLEHLNQLDDDGWQGTCGRCGTDHDGWPPDTIGGILRCRHTRARHRAGGTRWPPVAWYSRHRAGRLQAKIHQHDRRHATPPRA